MKKTLKQVVTVILAIAVLANVSVNSVFAAVAGEVSDAVLVSGGFDDAVVAAGRENAAVRPYWQGEPMEFVQATFAPMSQLQLFTLADENDAEGFIWGMWVTPGFVFYRHSLSDKRNELGWTIDWQAEDERIRPRLSAEREQILFANYPDQYKQLVSMDEQINNYLQAIGEDLDDLWWLYSSRDSKFKRRNALVSGLVKDVQNLEARIQDQLRERNDFYSYALDLVYALGQSVVPDNKLEPIEELVIDPVPEPIVEPIIDEIPFEELSGEIYEEFLLEDGSFYDLSDGSDWLLDEWE